MTNDEWRSRSRGGEKAFHLPAPRGPPVGEDCSTGGRGTQERNARNCNSDVSHASPGGNPPWTWYADGKGEDVRQNDGGKMIGGVMPQLRVAARARTRL